MKLTDIIHAIGDRVRLASRITALTGGTYAVDAVVITNQGLNYTTAAVAFSGGGGAAGTAVLSGGHVIAVTMTAPGSGYTTAPVVSFTGDGSGAAATATLLALSLDAIPTATIDVATPLVVSFLLNGRLNHYRLRAGVDAENAPFIIRPDDYNVGTNAKVWDLIGLTRLNDGSPLGSLAYAGTVDINFDGPVLQRLDLTGNVILTTSNRGEGKVVRLLLGADATPRNLTFPAWRFIGSAAPATLAAGKLAVLTLVGFGAADADVVAIYSVEP